MRDIKYALAHFEHDLKICITKCQTKTRHMVGSVWCKNKCEYAYGHGLSGGRRYVICTAPIRASELHKGVRV